MATALLPAGWPTPIPTPALHGKLVQLEPLTRAHVPELARAGSDPQVWTFTTSRADSPRQMQQYVEKLLHDWTHGTAAPFAARQTPTGNIVGCTRLKDLDRNHRRALLGSWYTPDVWRTGLNREAKLLLLRYAFEELECVRVEFHTDAHNTRSRTSLERLGACFEGVLRAHQITREGSVRDSAIYSIVAGEWDAVRTSIQQSLAR
jgi:RimJ/RimL family protein N-acetyltransferase